MKPHVLKPLLKALLSRRRFSKTRIILLLIVAMIVFIPEAWLGRFAHFIKGPPPATTPAPIERPKEIPYDGKQLTLSPAQRIRCRVERIIDGDTFTCDLNQDGHIQLPSEKIRLLQVDTPETKRSSRNPSGKPQPYGLEAKAYTKHFAAHKTLTLILDKKPRDRYGRTLALVYDPMRPQESLNEALVRKGLAKVLIYSPNYALRDEVKALEIAAKKAKRGLWSQAIS